MTLDDIENNNNCLIGKKSIDNSSFLLPTIQEHNQSISQLEGIIPILSSEKQNDALTNESIVDKNKLFEKIPDKKFVEYVIQTAQKTVKREDSLIRLILYTGLSPYTNDPLNLGIIAPTSEGKTYAVSEVIKFLPNQRSYQTKSSMPTNLTNKSDIHNSISTIDKKLLNYFAVNGFALDHNRELINSILQQIQNTLDAIVIPFSFFKHDKQLWIWIKNTSNKEKELHIIAVLEVLFGADLSNRRLMVI